MAIESLVDLAHIPYICPSETHPWRPSFDVMWRLWREANVTPDYAPTVAYFRWPPIWRILSPERRSCDLTDCCAPPITRQCDVTTVNSVIAWLSRDRVSTFITSVLLRIARFPAINDETRVRMFLPYWTYIQDNELPVLLHICNDYCTDKGHAYARIAIEARLTAINTLLWCVSDQGVAFLEQYLTQRPRLLSR